MVHLLPAAGNLLKEAVLHQTGDLVHGSLEDRLHHARELGLERDDRLGHLCSSLWFVVLCSFGCPSLARFLHETLNSFQFETKKGCWAFTDFK